MAHALTTEVGAATPVVVRAAAPGDIDAAAALHVRAFSSSIGGALGAGYARAFLGWFAAHHVLVVAELDGALVGYVAGAPDGYGPRLTRALLPTIVTSTLRHLTAVVLHPRFVAQLQSRAAHLLLRRERDSSIAEATPPGCFCLVGIATDERARGRGVGAALVDELCRRAAPAPVILDVFADNDAARALYRKAGFVDLARDGAVVRMVRTLRAG